MSVFFIYLTTVVVWGTTWLAIELQLNQVDPILSVGYRFIFAAIFLILFCRIRNISLNFSIRDHLIIGLQGITLYGFSYCLIYMASQYLVSGIVAVIFSTILIINILNLRFFLGQSVSPTTLFGGVLGCAGIGLVFWPELSAFRINESLIGLILAILATYSASIGNIIAVYISARRIGVTQANTLGMAYGGILVFVFGFFATGEIQFSTSLDYLLPLLYLAIFGSVIAFGCYISLINRIGADRAAYAIILNPILALLLSTFYENYKWTDLALIGVVLIVLGNVIVLIPISKLRQLSNYLSGPSSS